VSVGDSVSTEEDAEGHVTSRWRTPSPVAYASWHIGEFKFTVAQLDSLPEIRLVQYTGAHAQIGWDIQHSAGINAGGALVKPVGNDLVASLQFFTSKFGPLEANQLYALESYSDHGEAYPGFIVLDWTTFHGTDTWGNDEVLRAHEVAHQWWGLAIGPKTYRDRWLSEGLAEFCGLWFMQAKRHDTQLYLRSLSDMRERIVGVGDPAATWLGARSGEMANGYDAYVVAVYLRGAWVFHMLRCMLIDIDTMDETRFAGLMKDYATRYAGRVASTLDFQDVAERHLGEPMGWFFDQWVRGTAVPTYRYSWRSQRTAQGQYGLTLHVEQRGVPEGFRMPVPVRIELDNGTMARTRIWVDKPAVDITFGPFPAEPRHVEFNEFSAVLCRVVD
jgi:aminopeptidase N